MNAELGPWVDELGELLGILEDTDVEELELERDGVRLLVRRDPAGRTQVPAATEPAGDRISLEPSVVTAPMAGVFRRSAGGGAEALAEGDTIAAGQVVGAVEAMRMLNRIPSERSGVLEHLLVHDGQPVEYGQPLLALRAL